MYQGKRFQDAQRRELLAIIETMIRGDESMIRYSAIYASAFYNGMIPFRDQLDIHNQCLLSNALFQSDKIRYLVVEDLGKVKIDKNSVRN